MIWYGHGVTSRRRAGRVETGLLGRRRNAGLDGQWMLYPQIDRTESDLMLFEDFR